jgi:hypothetical protein
MILRVLIQPRNVQIALELVECVQPVQLLVVLAKIQLVLQVNPNAPIQIVLAMIRTNVQRATQAATVHRMKLVQMTLIHLTAVIVAAVERMKLVLA